GDDVGEAVDLGRNTGADGVGDPHELDRRESCRGEVKAGPAGSGVTPEIDGFADVIPEPSALSLLLGGLFLRRKR
ncbi:MAG: PEP-CTERM sorting domain-containing protein, partial [Planctomycetota bacterium]